MPVPLPLPADWVTQHRRRDSQVMLVIADPAVILALAHFGRIGDQVRAGDIVSRADFGPAPCSKVVSVGWSVGAVSGEPMHFGLTCPARRMAQTGHAGRWDSERYHDTVSP